MSMDLREFDLNIVYINYLLLHELTALFILKLIIL